MQYVSHAALVSLLLVVGACGPACTPPVADPGTGKADSSPAASKKDALPAPLPGEMVMEAKGVDTSKLSEAQRSQFFSLINTEPSACDKPHSLAKSLNEDAKCRDSLLVSQFIADRLAVGASSTAIKTELDEVRDSLAPRKINIEGRPVYGNERAPVTLVVFADFECPHCKAEAPFLRKAVDQFHGRVKLVYKHFPLSAHPRAKEAAIACEAALEQGKFWEMHDAVFAHQTQLEDADLKRYAREIGLDMTAFEAHFGARKGKGVVEADRAEGDKLDIQGTPTLYVNGRRVTELLFDGSINAWIDDALKR